MARQNYQKTTWDVRYMKKALFLLELIDYDHYDEIDKEDVEERYIIGYFSNSKNLDDAISLCKKRKEINEKIEITEFNFECGYNQKFVYVLFFEYSILKDNEYSDFYEYFEPQSSYKKCIIQKGKLLKMDKYKNRSNRIYEDSNDGFRVEKIKINFISHIDYINQQLFDVLKNTKKIIDSDSEISKKIYICNFLTYKTEKMKNTKISVVKNLLGKYVVTIWLDYEYSRFLEQETFNNKDSAANYAWQLLNRRCKN